MASFFEADDTYRGYHSTALLLPDAQVMTGGGDYLDSNMMEIFSPPYLFKPNSNDPADQPIITSAPTAVSYGASFTVQIAPPPTPQNITRATFLRSGSVTHSFNMEQRFLELMTLGGPGPAVQVTAPANSKLAPPGYYLLFLINNLGVPSKPDPLSPTVTTIIKLQS